MAKIGRNDLCPCGSGKKYKRCCMANDAAAARAKLAAATAAATAAHHDPHFCDDCNDKRPPRTTGHRRLILPVYLLAQRRRVLGGVKASTPAARNLLDPACAPGSSECRSAPRNGPSVSPRNAPEKHGRISHDP